MICKRPQDYCLKQIAVDLDLEGAALKLREAFGYGQTQSASIAVPGKIASDKALGYLIRVKVELGGRHILH